MTECAQNRLYLAEKFKECQEMILAIGNETRQQIVLALLENERVGLRVGEITALTHLSRPAVSHHVKILKAAKIITMKQIGTRNYYYMAASDTEWKKLADLFVEVYESIKVAIDVGYEIDAPEIIKE